MATRIDVAQKCRRRIESLELWLRRLIHDVLSEKYGNDYLNYKDGYKPIAAALQTSFLVSKTRLLKRNKIIIRIASR